MRTTRQFLSEKRNLSIFEILKRFENATGSKVNDGETKGIKLGPSQN